MFEAMYSAPGIGLAAPQVGVGLRFAVLDLMPDEKPTPLVLINPEIVAVGEELATREEGCLSLPGQYADVTRPAEVRVRYRDLDGTAHEIEGEGLLAACLQHEMDHLDGMLFVDHVSRAEAQHDPAPAGQGAAGAAAESGRLSHAARLHGQSGFRRPAAPRTARRGP